MSLIQNKNFRPDIEGLRGIAILVVVAYHANIPGFTGGYVGVDVFFVLSGYLITGILAAEYDKKGTISLSNFYSRRARRLLPAAAVTLFVTIIAAYLVFPPIQQTTLPETAISTALYSSNLYFLHTTTDYLAAPPESNPLLHTWSLSVEEQFYFVFPLLTLITLRYGSRRKLRIVIGIIAFISFGLCVYFTSTRQPIAFFSSPTRAWEFAVGALGVLSTGFYKPRYQKWIGWAGIAAILGACIVFDRHTSFPGWAALIPVLGTIAVLMYGVSVSRVLSTPFLQFFGRLSYSWYLWHWVVLVFTVALWGELSLPYRILAVLVSLIIAQVSYSIIENPVRVSTWFSRRPAYGLAMALALTLIGAGTGFVFRHLSREAKTSPPQSVYTEAKAMPEGLYENCDRGLYESAVKECVFGNPDSAKTVVLFGDSHALQWLVATQIISEAENWRIVTIIKSGCGPIDVEIKDSRLTRSFYECNQWRASAFDRIREVKPELVIVGGLQRVAFIEAEYRIPLDKWVEGLERTFDALRQSGAKIAYIADTPRPNFDVLNCLARNDWQIAWREAATCSFGRGLSVSDDLVRREQQAAAINGVQLIDMNKYICPDTVCEPVLDGIIVYRDSHHLSTAFGQHLSTALRGELGK